MLSVRSSFFFRLKLVATLSTIAVLLCFSFLLWYYGSDAVFRYYQRQAEKITDSIAASATGFVAKKNISGLEQVLHNYALYDDILFITVYDSDERRIAYVINDLEVWNSYNTDIYSSGKYITREALIIPDDGGEAAALSAVYGKVVVGYSQEYYNIFREYFAMGVVALSFVVAAMVGIVIHLFTAGWKSGLDKLLDDAWHVSHGDISHEVTVADDRNDEVGQLAAMLDSLRKSLLRRETELRRIRDNLKLQVKERTFEVQIEAEKAQISSKNASLYLSEIIRSIYSATSKITAKIDDIISANTEKCSPATGDIGEVLADVKAIKTMAQSAIDNMPPVGSRNICGYESQPFDVYKAVENVLKEMLPVCHEKQCLIWLNYDVSSPQVVCGDEKRLQQVIRIILDSLLRITEGGTIEVKVWSSPTASGGYLYSFEIYDSNCNMNQGEIAEMTGETEKDKNLAKGGKLPMGMPVCRQIIEDMNGRLRANSSKGQGVCLSVELVMEAADATNEIDKGGVKNSTVMYETLKNRHTLIISKNDSLVQLLQGCLEKTGMRVAAIPVKQAVPQLEDIAKKRKLCVIIDAQTVDPLPIVKKIENISLYKRLAVIILSSGGRGIDSAGSKNNGVTIVNVDTPVGNVSLLEHVISGSQ